MPTDISAVLPHAPSTQAEPRAFYIPSTGAQAALALLFCAVLLDISYNGFSISGYSTPLVTVGVPAFAVFYGWWRNMNPRLLSLVSALATLFATVMLSSIIQYAAAPHGGKELADHALLAADRALGLNWFAVVAFFDQSKLFSDILLLFYQSIGAQMLTLLVVFMLRRDFTGFDAFISALAFMILGACFVAALVPAIGVTGIVDVSFPNTPILGGRSGQSIYLALRSGALRTINLTEMYGLITFPSGHAAFCVLATLAARRIPYAFWPFVAVNTLMLLSTITHGGHYFVDLFAGTLLAVVGWKVGLAVAAWRPAALAMLRPARPQA